MTLSRRIAAGFGIAALIAWRVFAIDHDVASVAPPGADVVGSQLFCAKSALYTEDGGVAYQWEVQYHVRRTRHAHRLLLFGAVIRASQCAGPTA